MSFTDRTVGQFLFHPQADDLTIACERLIAVVGHEVPGRKILHRGLALGGCLALGCFAVAASFGGEDLLVLHTARDLKDILYLDRALGTTQLAPRADFVLAFDDDGLALQRSAVGRDERLG